MTLESGLTCRSVLTSRSRRLRSRRRPLRPRFKLHCRTSLRASNRWNLSWWARQFERHEPTNWTKTRTKNKEQTWSSERVENIAFKTFQEMLQCRKFTMFHEFSRQDSTRQSRRSKEARARVEELMESLKSMLTSEVWLPWSTWSQFSWEKWTELPSSLENVWETTFIVTYTRNSVCEYFSNEMKWNEVWFLLLFFVFCLCFTCFTLHKSQSFLLSEDELRRIGSMEMQEPCSHTESHRVKRFHRAISLPL